MMAAAGLTHGGFYRHFRNKEHLVAEALSVVGDKTIATIGRNMAKGGFNAAVGGYLSGSHRDAPTHVCPFAALGSDIARLGDDTKAAAASLQKLLVLWPAKGPAARRRAAMPSLPCPR
jgi:TetR/AcrR family transcriptional repressor of nem operon